MPAEKNKGRALSFYDYFLMNRRRLTLFISFVILLISLVIGAGLRVTDIKENFDIIGGFEFYVDMASHFWTDPGGYNFEQGLKIKERPDNYVFTRHPKEPATGSFENEKGWEFILSLILKEGTKGVKNLAMTVVRYQLMLELLVIVLLFFSGRSIAGPFGGSFAAILYALFKPSIRMMSWVSYYYWAIPFSALSLFFWTTIYKPEKKTYSLRFSSLLFFLYGLVVGFATSVRLNFLFLPLFLSPLIFFRERAFKRGIVLLLFMLIGQGILLIPQVLITHKYYDKFTLSVRGKWHHVISGFGAYPNPFGIKDSADLTAVDWAISRGGPDLNKVGIQEYDKFMKKEAIRLIKERPDIFLQNFKTNLYAGITMATKHRFYRGGPVFFGIMDSDKTYTLKTHRFAKPFPWLVLFSIFIFFFFRRKRLGPLITVVFQGLYVLGILCIYFPATPNHVTAYFPVFVLLLAVALAVLGKGTVSILEGGLRCWVNDRGIKHWSAMVKECFREDWDKKYCPTIEEQPKSGIKSSEKWQWRYPKMKWLIFCSGILVLFVGLFIVKTGNDMTDDRTTQIDDRTIEIINNTLRPETNGGFESWSNGESSPPDGWIFTQLNNGKGAGIKRATGIGKVKIGASSVRVQAGRSGTSQIFFTIPSGKLYYLVGKTIIIEGWVKSSNEEPDKVYISTSSMNGRDNPCKKISYKNSGEWEKLKITYKVPNDTQRMYIQCNVVADAFAYFDGIRIKYNMNLKK